MKHSEHQYHYWKVERTKSKWKKILLRGVLLFGLAGGVFDCLFTYVTSDETLTLVSIISHFGLWMLTGVLWVYYDWKSNEYEYQRNKKYYQKLEERKSI